MKRKSTRNKLIPTPLLLVLLFAVIAPCVALSLLALRAADRESVYLERRLESTLLAEVDLAAQSAAEVLSSLSARLLASSGGVQARNDLQTWQQDAFMIETTFLLRGGELTLSGADPRSEAAFRENFAAFLEGKTNLPIYDSIAHVYKKELDVASYEKEAHPAAPSAIRQESVLVKKQSTAAAEKIAKSQIAADAEFKEQAYTLAEGKGFSLTQRNVMPQASQAAQEMAAEDFSGTVAKNRSFAELRAQGASGLLPRLTERGLALLFWRQTENGDVVGCSVDMSILKDQLIAALPDIYSDVRILTILDDDGTPLVAPDARQTLDWRRPFVSREISPLLPRWEIAAWLSNPELLTSQARFTRLLVWGMVAALFLVITTGAFLVLRMLSYEMRVARQKTTFVATVSHELKTPLTSIRLFAEMLLSGKQKDEGKRQEYLKTMMSEAERLSGLVDNVLTFSKGDAVTYQMEPLDLAELAEDVPEQLRPHLAKQGFDVTFADGKELPVIGNRQALKQVLMNLISNAEKYSDTVREIQVECARGGGNAEVRVSDRGIGISPDSAAKIFDEFYRADESLSALRSGTGLGLPISRGIARKHGGDIRYEPRKGGGSTFILSLPLRSQKKEALGDAI